MKSKEIRTPDEKLLIPEASSKAHWRNASTSFHGTEFCSNINEKKKKKLHRVQSTKTRKRNFLRSNLKRCKSSPLNACDHWLLEEFKPREVHKTRSSILQPRRLQFLSEKSTNKRNEVKEVEIIKVVVSENSKKKAIRSADLYEARPVRKHAGFKWSAPSFVELVNKQLTCRTKQCVAMGDQTDVNDFRDQITKLEKWTSKNSCADSINDENVKLELSPKSAAPKDRVSENRAIEWFVEKISSLTNSNLIIEKSAKEVCKTSGKLNKDDVQKCRLLEDKSRETKIQSQVAPAKINDDNGVIGSDMNHDSNQELEIKKPEPVGPLIESHINESYELEKSDTVNLAIQFGSCKNVEIEKPEHPLDLQQDSKNSRTSEQPSMPRDQLCPSKETSHDEPESIIIAGSVKLLTSKYEFQHEHPSESCLKPRTTTNKVDEANDRILKDGLHTVDESTAGIAKDISGKTEVEPQQQVQRISEGNDGRDEPVFDVSKDTILSNEQNCRNEQREVELTSVVLAIIPQNNHLNEDEPIPEINLGEENEKFITITESPLEVTQLSRNSQTTVKNSDIAVTNQICGRPDKSTCISPNKAEIVEINQIYDSLRGIQIKWGGHFEKKTDIERWSAWAIRRDAGRDKNDVTEETEGENWCHREDVFEEADEGIKRNVRVLMSDSREGEDINTSKKDECKSVAVKKAAQEAADHGRPNHKVKDPHVTKGGESLRTPPKPAAQSFPHKRNLGSWSCTVCTFRNSAGDFCEVCLERRQRQNEFTLEHFYVKKKSMVTSMKRKWWKKLRNRNK